jgi:hypothetical protein
LQNRTLKNSHRNTSSSASNASFTRQNTVDIHFSPERYPKNATISF